MERPKRFGDAFKDMAILFSFVVNFVIRLGEAGLDAAVEERRAVFRPLRARIESLPDGIELP